MPALLDDSHASFERLSEKRTSIEELPEVGRNAIVLPPLGESAQLRHSCSARRGEAGRRHHSSNSKKKHSGATPAEDANHLREGGRQERQLGYALVSAAGVASVGIVGAPETAVVVAGFALKASRVTTNFGQNIKHDGVACDDDRKQSPRHTIAQQEEPTDFGHCKHHVAVDDGGNSCSTDAALQGGSRSLSDSPESRRVEHGDCGRGSHDPTNSLVENGKKELKSDDCFKPLLDVLASAQTPPIRGKPLLGGGARGSSPFSPGAAAAISARVRGRLRNLLTLGSEAQVLPAARLPLSAAKEKPTPNRQQQSVRTGRLPISWNRLKLGRGKKEPTAKVMPASFDDAQDSVVHDDSKRNLCCNNNDDYGSNTKGVPFDDGSGCTNDDQRAHGEIGQVGGARSTTSPINSQKRRVCRHSNGGREAGVDETSKVLDSDTDDGDCDDSGRTTIHGNRDTGTDKTAIADLDSSVAAAAAAAAEKGSPKAAEEETRRTLTRDLTLVDRDQWPPVLDNEMDPEKWSLDKGEIEVLAAAKRMGSVLVRVITWNLHAKPTPGMEQLRKTLLPPGKFHIFAVGTEECQNSIAKSVIVHSKKEWESILKETLGSSYEMLCGHALQATHNAVFAHRGIIPLLRSVRSSAVATGLSLGAPGTTLGNKGGVGISFSVGATSCIFVNSHLAAHQNNVRERNDHFFQISQGLVRELGPGSGLPRGLPSTDDGLDSTPCALDPALPSLAARVEDGVGRGDEFPAAYPAGAINISKSQNCGDHEEQHSVNKSSSCSAITAIASDVMTPTQLILQPTASSNETQSQPKAPPAAQATKVELPHHLMEEDINDNTPPLSPDPRAAQQPGCPSSPSCQGTGGKGSGDISHRYGRRERSNSGHHAGQGGGQERHGKTLPEVFDRVVWAGDLNYRVNAPRAVADLLLSKDMHAVLLKNEQLTLERKKGGPSAPFTGYREGPLNFRPTYKFDSGTDTYDSSSKQRVPAWTDRVLFAGAAARTRDKLVEKEEAGAKEFGMHLSAYRSIGELRTSDHRPVFASFVMEFDQREDAHDVDDGEEAAVTNQTSSEVCSVM